MITQQVHPDRSIPCSTSCCEAITRLASGRWERSRVSTEPAITETAQSADIRPIVSIASFRVLWRTFVNESEFPDCYYNNQTQCRDQSHVALRACAGQAVQNRERQQFWPAQTLHG